MKLNYKIDQFISSSDETFAKINKSGKLIINNTAFNADKPAFLTKEYLIPIRWINMAQEHQNNLLQLELTENKIFFVSLIN